MLVKITRTPGLRTRVIASAAAPAPPGEPFDELKKRMQEAVRRFHSEPVTPQRFLELENELKATAPVVWAPLPRLPGRLNQS